MQIIWLKLFDVAFGTIFTLAAAPGGSMLFRAAGGLVAGRAVDTEAAANSSSAPPPKAAELRSLRYQVNRFLFNTLITSPPW